MFEPIRRYVIGADIELRKDVQTFIEKKLGRSLASNELDDLNKVLGSREYMIPFAAMPIGEGVEHLRFLVELVIAHYRYSVSSASAVGGALVVGGKVQIGRVTYRDERFIILS